MKITVTMELTQENLSKLRALLPDTEIPGQVSMFDSPSEKPVEPAKLRESVRRMISKNIAHRREAIDVERKRERFAMLTEREQLVVRLVARDMLNKQIAAELDIQEHTVKIHRSNACRKLEVRSALELHHYLSAIGELAEDQKASEDRDFTDD